MRARSSAASRSRARRPRERHSACHQNRDIAARFNGPCSQGPCEHVSITDAVLVEHASHQLGRLRMHHLPAVAARRVGHGADAEGGTGVTRDAVSDFGHRLGGRDHAHHHRRIFRDEKSRMRVERDGRCNASGRKRSHARM